MEAIGEVNKKLDKFREGGKYKDALEMILSLTKEAKESFGQFSGEYLSFCIRTTEVAMEMYFHTDEKKYAIFNAYAHAWLSVEITKEHFPYSVAHQHSRFLLARILIDDKWEVLYFREEMSKEDYKNLIRTNLETSISLGELFLSKGGKYLEDKEFITSLISNAKEELKWVDSPEARPKDVIARCFYNEDLKGWLTVYTNTRTGEFYFDAKDVCNMLGISLEEAINLIPREELFQMPVNVVNKDSMSPEN
jgi:hypothetical protein